MTTAKYLRHSTKYLTSSIPFNIYNNGRYYYSHYIEGIDLWGWPFPHTPLHLSKSLIYIETVSLELKTNKQKNPPNLANSESSKVGRDIIGHLINISFKNPEFNIFPNCAASDRNTTCNKNLLHSRAVHSIFVPLESWKNSSLYSANPDSLQILPTGPGLGVKQTKSKSFSIWLAFRWFETILHYLGSLFKITKYLSCFYCSKILIMVFCEFPPR